MLGHSVAASLNQPLKNFVVEEDWPLLAELLAETSDRFQKEWPAIRMRHIDGSVCWFELASTKLDDGAVVGALHDVTQQQLARKELSKLSLVASSTDNLVIITNAKGEIEWIHAAFTRKTGYELQDVLGRTPGSLLQGPETDHETIALIREHLSQGRSFECQILNYTKAGIPYWVTLHISPIHNRSRRSGTLHLSSTRYDQDPGGAHRSQAGQSRG